MGQPRDTHGTTTGQRRDNHGTTMGQLRDNHGTTTGQPRDNYGTTTGQPRDNHGTTMEKPQDNHGTTTGQPRDNPGPPFDGGGRNIWPEIPLATAASRLSRALAQLRLARTHDTNTKPKPIVRLGLPTVTPPNLRFLFLRQIQEGIRKDVSGDARVWDNSFTPGW